MLKEVNILLFGVAVAWRYAEAANKGMWKSKDKLIIIINNNF